MRREGSKMGEGEGVGTEMGKLRERLFVDGYGRGGGEIGCWCTSSVFRRLILSLLSRIITHKTRYSRLLRDSGVASNVETGTVLS